MSLPKKIWEKFLLEFQVCLHCILYIFTSPSAENSEKSVYLGRLFLHSRPVGYSLKKYAISIGNLLLGSLLKDSVARMSASLDNIYLLTVRGCKAILKFNSGNKRIISIYHEPRYNFRVITVTCL